jgi:glycosyltransferase involved in cell wall biosynthesis
MTGIGLYTRQLHRALSGAGESVDRWGARTSGERPRRSASRTAWTMAHLASALSARRPRLFHALANFNLPLQRVPGVPYVLTVHDLVPLLLPETVSTAFRWQFRFWLARATTVAEQIICVSNVTRASLLEHLDLDPSKITVIHHGADHVESVAPPDRITTAWLDAQGFPDPFVLYAGALDARKNIELVLRAIEYLFRQGRRATLVLAGQRWFGSGTIEREVVRLKNAGLDVRVLGYLEDSVFYALMKRAGVFVFPSRYEGFGLPPLEAMRLGVPTIVSDAGSLPEICGQGALSVGVDDVSGLAQRLDTLLGDASARAARAQAGLEHARLFSWAKTASQTQAVYAKTAR